VISIVMRSAFAANDANAKSAAIISLIRRMVVFPVTCSFA
jgi:hypothetical protein